MSTIFTKIINGEISSFKIEENEFCYAFLDINPLQKGHVLVVPKQEMDYIFDLQDDILKELMLFSKRISKAVKKSFNCNRIGLTVIGLEVPHAHIHLIPINKLDDMNFSKPKMELSNEELKDIQEKIISNLD